MPHRLTAAALAVLAIGAAHAEGSRGINLSGYGTLSVVNARLDQADFVENIFQPTGAGFTRRTSMDVDSKLGVQADGTITDDLFAVLQLVSKHQYDNSYRPQVEWANVKYQS